MAPVLKAEFSTSIKNSTDGKVYFTTTKETSQYIYTVVYNVIPTIAYRANHLGINIMNPSDDTYTNAEIVIGTSSNRNVIYLVGENGKATIELPVKLDNNSTDELSEVRLNGFIINCGSW